ncbi:MAG TPA: DUF3568 family protein [Planctomycetota bacterium]|nr:DUF3568 family protein [Planctomycetota bacterium]
MKMRLFLPAILALSLPFATTGCPAVLFGAGAAAGAGALGWQAGWLRGTIGEPIERVHRAAKAALSDFKARQEEESLKPTSGMVDATMPDGRRVVVETKSLGAKETQVRVRVGLWGDQAVSLQIFEQIKKHL